MSELICPCDVIEHPRWITNPPGLTSIAYRIGDYSTFREALLRSREGEQALYDWRPSASGDLAVQLLEWWAYLADVLVFYNERAMNEVLLRTAVFPEDVRRIVRLLGYRPRPGIGATGLVAAILDAPRPFVVPRGFPIQGALESGAPPQVFEVDDDMEMGLLGRPLPPSARFPKPPGLTPAFVRYPPRDKSGNLLNDVPAIDAKKSTMPDVVAGKSADVGIKGVVSAIGPDDTVLILRRDWNGEDPGGRALAIVHDLSPRWDTEGKPITVLTLHPGQSLPSGIDRSEYRILKATKLAHLWLYHERYQGAKTPSVGGQIGQVFEQIFDPAGLFSGGISKEPPQDAHAITSSTYEAPQTGAAHLEAITRGIVPGDPVLFAQLLDAPGGILGVIAQIMAGVAGATQTLDNDVAFLAKVTGYSELLWYANPPEGDRIGQGPPVGPPSHGLISGGASPIPIPHSKITFDDRHGRASTMGGGSDEHIKTIVMHYGWEEIGELADIPSTDPIDTPAVPGTHEIPANQLTDVLIEDATGAGVPGWVGRTNIAGPGLVGPLRALLNLLPISRGQTVAHEVLGSGSALAIHQEFVLSQKPLTYLANTGPGPTNGYRSTLRIWVHGIEWHEVASFFEQPAGAHVFVTREDDQQRTFVTFGTGELGARLPTGVDNVIASYRYGSGAAVPPIGALTTMLRPLKGLQSIRNPIQPGGGEDPDPPEKIRQYAPRSVLTFGRAISGDDYETIVSQTPGVSRAKVEWGWDPRAQRSMVKVFVGDDIAAVVAARGALRAFSDPNRPILVALASPIYLDVTLTLEIDPDFDPAPVQAAVSAALLDPDRTPLGSATMQIGHALYNSEIYDACLRVRGVVAVHHLAIRTAIEIAASPIHITPGFRREYTMWTGALFSHPVERWSLDPGERHVPGEGRFFLLQGDHLHLMTELSRHG